MRKEVLFAIISGVTIGLFIAFGAWNLTKFLNKRPNTQQTQKTPAPKQNLSLSISNLNNYDIVTSDLYTITGIATPNTTIVVSTTEEDFFTTSKDDGTFEVEVNFPAGLSEVKINDQKLLIIYSTEFEKYTTDNDSKEDKESETQSKEDETATSQGIIKDTIDEIRENVKNEIANKSLKKIAYIGTITDISSNNLQIKSIEGDIKQIAVDETSEFINTLKKNAEVKLNDLAIGDYIIAMGFVNGKESLNNGKVLEGKRILIAVPFEENNYIYEEIEIYSVSKTKINDITLPKKWKGPNTAEIEEGQKIIVVGTTDKNKNYSLRSIFTPVE